MNMKLKTLWVSATAALTLALAAPAVWADGTSSVPGVGMPKYEGTFQIQPHVMHSGPISGKMDLLYDGDVLKQIKLALDAPVFGMSNLSSSDQWASALSTDSSSSQTVFAFRLQGPPHGWYFVLVATSGDGGQTLQGTMYRANAKLPDIQNAAKAPIATPPASWKALGSAVLKKL